MGGRPAAHAALPADDELRLRRRLPLLLLRPLLARAAQEGAAAGLEVEVFDETALAEMGAGALLAVGQGSVRPPRLVRLSYVPENPSSNDHLFLVGKGITFDTGGLSLKPPGGMEKMKYDMGGAGTMLGAITAIGRLKPGVRVSCLLAMAENMPSGTATRPGDIITALNGKTIEVINTDAEGRLLLCDALSIACEENPELIVDYATLTGAARVAVGTEIAAMFSNDAGLASAISTAANKTDDPVWPLPLHEDYTYMLSSKVADLVNSAASGFAGASTAALFLKHFVGDAIPWLHFDVMAFNNRARPGRPEGGEAMALRAVYEYLEQNYGDP